jgi:hypothetical protein
MIPGFSWRCPGVVLELSLKSNWSYPRVSPKVVLELPNSSWLLEVVLERLSWKSHLGEVELEKLSWRGLTGVIPKCSGESSYVRIIWFSSPLVLASFFSI